MTSFQREADGSLGYIFYGSWVFLQVWLRSPFVICFFVRVIMDFPRSPGEHVGVL
jgi:hypothetical protein